MVEPDLVSVVEVEIVKPELNLDPTASLQKNEHLFKTAEPVLEDSCSVARDNKTTNAVNSQMLVCDVEVLQANAELTCFSPNVGNRRTQSSTTLDPKLEKLLDRYNRGEIGKLPEAELKMLAAAVIGDTVKLYRRSGQILNSSPNDFDRGFLGFIAIRDKQDFVYGTRLIPAIERTPSRWGELVEFVAAWRIGDAQAIPNAAKQIALNSKLQHSKQSTFEAIKDL